MPEVAYYLMFYGLMLIVAVGGMAIPHALPADVGIAMISFVLGHGAGLFAPPPSTSKPMQEEPPK